MPFRSLKRPTVYVVGGGIVCNRTSKPAIVLRESGREDGRVRECVLAPLTPTSNPDPVAPATPSREAN